MKTIFKAIIFILAIMATLSPTSASAQQYGRTDVLSESTNCSRYESEKISNNMSDKLDALTLAITNREVQLSAKRNEWDEKRSLQRATSESQRQAHYDGLRERASTELQQEAVEEFVSAIELAIAARNQKIDEAREEFRTGVNQTIESQKVSLKSALEEFRNDVIAAHAKAKQSCENRAPNQDVSETFHSEIESARQDLANAKESASKLTEAINALTESRGLLMTQAKTSFRESFNEAKLKLELALKAS